jgi:D-arabinonate dehydratase
MKIAEVRSAVAVVPLRQPIAWSTVSVAEREYLLVWVVGEDGATGFGYGLGSRFANGARFLHNAVQDLLAPVLVGAESWMPAQLWQAMHRRTLLLGRRGAVLRAMSAVDIALWDLNAKTVGQPLFKLLGGHREAVPAYASGGYYGKDKGLADFGAEIERYVARGFRQVKIKVGGAGMQEDEARLRLAREIVGESGEVALDANNAWTSLAAAARAVRRFEAYDPWWLEEPFPPDSIGALAELAGRTSIPLATGELEATRWPFRELIERHAVHVIQADATVCGGITEWMRIAALAAGFDLPVAPHWAPDIHAHLVAAVENGMAVEYFTPDEDIVNFEMLLARRLDVRGGVLALGNQPGHGVVLDPEAVKRFTVLDSSAAPIPC